MDDSISRQAAIDALDGEIEITGRANAEAVKDYIRLVKGRIEQLPAADVVEKEKGKWIREPNCWYRCSQCGSHYPSLKGTMEYNYCPECGSDMREEKTDE